MGRSVKGRVQRCRQLSEPTPAEKILSPPLQGQVDVVTYIQPHLILRGVIGLSALDRRAFQRRYQPQVLVPNSTVS
jgi:hypothetical protein